jgi:hypothetical protein
MSGRDDVRFESLGAATNLVHADTIRSKARGAHCMA